VRVYGSYSLTGAIVIPAVLSGTAVISVTPAMLPVESDRKPEVTVVASESSTIILGPILRCMSQISIAITLKGLG